MTQENETIEKLSSDMLKELRTVSGNPKLSLDDVTRFNRTGIKAEKGETVYLLKKFGVRVAVKS